MNPAAVCRRPGCGHLAAGHQHYRRGSECSELACSCPRLRTRWTLADLGWGARLLVGMWRAAR